MLNASFARCHAQTRQHRFRLPKRRPLRRHSGLCPRPRYRIFEIHFSVGNKADVSANSICSGIWPRTTSTDVILMYLETLANGRAFIELAREITGEIAHRKPISWPSSPAGPRKARRPLVRTPGLWPAAMPSTTPFSRRPAFLRARHCRRTLRLRGRVLTPTVAERQSLRHRHQRGWTRHHGHRCRHPSRTRARQTATRDTRVPQGEAATDREPFPTPSTSSATPRCERYDNRSRSRAGRPECRRVWWSCSHRSP
jgi:hypothetical protein